MKISNEFVVSRTVDAVWEFFQDVPTVTECLPGAQITEDKGDGVFAGSVSAKLGPMSVTFEGEAIVAPNAVDKSVHISGKGVDRQGGSQGQIKVDYRLDEIESGTKVTLDADVTLSGSVAQFGRTGLINELSTRLIVEFAECLDKKLAAATPEEAAIVKAAEIRGISLFFTSLGSWIVSFFRRLLRRG